MKQKQAVKATHMMIYTKLRQVEKFSCPIPSAKNFNLEVGFLWANFTQNVSINVGKFLQRNM